MKYLFAYTLVSIFSCGCDSPQNEITGVILPITNDTEKCLSISVNGEA